VSRTIAICGRTCAGKTSAGNHLAAKLGLMHIEASSIMREVWSVSGSSLTLDEFAEHLLRDSPERVPKAAAERAEGRPLVVTGLRSPDEVAELSDARGGSLVIFIDADPDTRFARCLNRNRPGHPRTMRDLEALDHIHNRMGLGQIETAASTLRLASGQEIESLQRALERLVSDHIG
jgi:dephospho-CoA kinase